MMFRHVALVVLIAAGIGLFAWQGVQPRAPRTSAEAATPADETVEAAPVSGTGAQRRLGPFTVGDRSYTVVVDEMPRAAGPTEETGSAVTAMEIQDSSGEVHYRRSFPYVPESDTFSEAWLVSAQRFAGATGSGLLLTYEFDSQPSAPAPENSGWYQLFGIVDGRLKPFSGPISIQGSLIPPASKADLLQFKVWAHHFRLVFSVAVNWEAGTLSPEPTCDTCEYAVLPEDLSRREDLTFVLMCPSATQCDTADRTLVRRESVIELLSARAGLHWSEGSPDSAPVDFTDTMPDQGEIRASGDVWLKIRIDGQEGWLHNNEDFLALAFPFEQ